MDAADKERIQRNLEDLIPIPYPEIRDKLIQEGVLDDDDHDSLNVPMLPARVISRKLYETILRKGKRGDFRHLCDALREAGYDHLVEQMLQE